MEQGIQWIDTAPIYGLYHSETVVGEAMKHIDRDKVAVSYTHLDVDKRQGDGCGV